MSIRSYKVRLFPDKEQEAKMWQHIGASRWVWNYMLEEQKRRYENGEKHMSAFDMNRFLTEVKHKEENSWLHSISTGTLQRTCADLAQAYNDFFGKRSGFPKFKNRKRSKTSFPLAAGKGPVWFGEDLVHIPLVGKVPYQTNYQLPIGRDNKLSNPRVTYTPNEKWILSFGVECENQALELSDKPMGIDLGIKELAVVSFCDEQLVFHNINKSRKVRRLEKRLKHLQRNVARKYKQNGNYEKTKSIVKAEKKVRLAHYHLDNIRQNYRHLVTHELISKLPSRVVMEDLNVKGMIKNKHLSKAIVEMGFSEFIRQMKYKCEWNGIEFVQVPRFYPSSKTCSCCGSVKDNLKLKDRTYICPVCGLEIDRDYNAAINLMKYVA